MIFPTLQHACADVAPEEIPAALGELEHAKAMLMQRLSTPQPVSLLKPWLRIPDVAAHLQLPVSQVRTLAHMKHGGLPFQRFGKHFRISRDALQHWEAEQGIRETIRLGKTNSLDKHVSLKYTSSYDRQGTSTQAQAARMDTKATRGRAARASALREQMGNGHSTDHTDDGAVH